MIAGAYRLSPSGDSQDDAGDPLPFRGRATQEDDDLPYKVEVWDPSKSEVEHVVAVTSSASIGYAAYYAATLEFPQRYITLRHKEHVLSRWNGPGH